MTSSLEEINKLKNYNRNVEALDSVNEFLKNPELNEEERYKAEKIKVRIIEFMKEYKKAIDICNAVIIRLETIGNNFHIADMLLYKAELQLAIDNFEEYSKTVEKTKTIIDKSIEKDNYHYRILESQILFLEAVYESSKNNHIESLQLFEKSYELRKNEGEKELILDTLIFIIVKCFWLGESEKGTEYGDVALKILEKYDAPIWKQELLETLSMVHTKLGNFELALELNHESALLAKELNKEFEVYILMINESWQLMYLGEYEKASNLALKGLEYMRKKDNKWWMFFAHIFLSFNQSLQDKTDDALQNAFKALELAKDFHFKFLKIMAYKAIGDSYKRLGELDKALEYRLRVLEDLKDIEKSTSKPPIYADLIDIYLEKNNIDEAKRVFVELEEFYENNKTEFTKQHYLISKALLLMRNSDPRERGKAELLLEQLSEEENIDFYLKVYSLFNLCVLFLTDFQLTGDVKLIAKLTEWLNKLLKITEEKEVLFFMIQVHILQAKIAATKMSITEAKNHLDLAKKIAKENNLEGLLKEIMKEEELLNRKIATWKELVKEDIPIQIRIKEMDFDSSIKTMKKQISTDIYQESRKEPQTMTRIFSLKI